MALRFKRRTRTACKVPAEPRGRLPWLRCRQDTIAKGDLDMGFAIMRRSQQVAPVRPDKLLYIA